MIYWLGRKSKKFRIWYYRRTNKWLWGIVGAFSTPELFEGHNGLLDTNKEAKHIYTLGETIFR